MYIDVLLILEKLEKRTISSVMWLTR